MKYRVTIRPITDTAELAPPGDNERWQLHSFECIDDRLVVMWQLDDVGAHKLEKHAESLRRKIVGLEGRMCRVGDALGNLAPHVRDGRVADVAGALEKAHADLNEAIREHGDGYGAC